MKYFLILSLTSLVACAQPVSHIKPDATRAAKQYNDFACPSYMKHIGTVDELMNTAAKAQKLAIASDVVAILVIGIPLSGGGENKKIARLKGERIALERGRSSAGCDV